MLIVLGKLFNTFSTDSGPEFDETTCQDTIAHLEKRWNRLEGDREVFILALIFNPYVRTKCFNPRNPATTPGELASMFERVFKRLMGQTPDSSLMHAFDSYLNNIGRWSDASLRLSEWKDRANMEVCREY